MFLVSKANFFSEKNTGFLSHRCHKTAAAFDEYDEYDKSNDCVLLLFLFY